MQALAEQAISEPARASERPGPKLLAPMRRVLWSKRGASSPSKALVIAKLRLVNPSGSVRDRATSGQVAQEPRTREPDRYRSQRLREGA